MGFPGGTSGRCRRRNRQGSVPGLGRSPGGGHGNPLQHSCLENPMDKGAWWATVHRVAKELDKSERLITHIILTNVKKCNSAEMLMRIK